MLRCSAITAEPLVDKVGDSNLFPRLLLSDPEVRVAVHHAVETVGRVEGDVRPGCHQVRHFPGMSSLPPGLELGRHVSTARGVGDPEVQVAGQDQERGGDVPDAPGQKQNI